MLIGIAILIYKTKVMDPMDITSLLKDDYVVVDENTSVSEMIGRLKRLEKRYALVFRKKKYLGMVEKKSLLRSRMDAGKAKLAGHIMRTPVLSHDKDAIECAYLMFKSGLDVLPVEKNKKIIGVLEGPEVALAAGDRLKKVKVQDVKLLRPRLLRRNDPVSTALEIMHDERIDQVPLFDTKSSKSLYGIISYRDLLRHYLNWTPKRDFSAKFNKLVSTRGGDSNLPGVAELPVENFATSSNLAVVSPESSLPDALSLMRSRNLQDLLVMRQELFVGLLTVKNILRFVGSFKASPVFAVKFVGLNKTHLEPQQKSALESIACSEAVKLQRQLRNEEFSITVHVKEYQREGKKHKYSVHCRLEYPGQSITVSQEDWDIETAMHKTFENARNAVKKKFRSDVSWKKSYG